MDENEDLERVITQEEAVAPSAEPSIQKLQRLWPVFVVFLLTFGAVMLAQIIGVAILAAWLLLHRANLDQLQTQLVELLLTPGAFLGLASLTQIVVVGGATIPAFLSPLPARQRLGLVPSGLSGAGYALVLLGLAFPIVLGSAIATGLEVFGKVTDPFRPVYEQMTWPLAVVFTLFVALVPSVVEEMLFRGYMQRRLLERWRPWAAILVTTLLFALFHLNLLQSLGVLPFSLWVGYLAWRLGSIWPCIFSHALNNSIGCIWNIGAAWGLITEGLSWAAVVTISLVSFALFVCAVGELELHAKRNASSGF